MPLGRLSKTPLYIARTLPLVKKYLQYSVACETVERPQDETLKSFQVLLFLNWNANLENVLFLLSNKYMALKYEK